jgi:GIY-YIG catalytic domain protein
MENNDENKIVCVYKLYFINDPNKVYVGSTIDFQFRLNTHYKELLENKHSNVELQKDFKIFGVLNLRWEIIKEFKTPISRKELLEYESKYILLLKSYELGYNRTYITTSKENFYISERPLNKDITNLLNEFKKGRIVHIESIKIKSFEIDLYNLKKYTYSDAWWNKQPKEVSLHKIYTLTTHLLNKYKCSRYNIYLLFRNKKHIKDLTGIPSKYASKQEEVIRGLLKRTLDSKRVKHKIQHIEVLSAFYPFNLENKTQEEKENYQIYEFLMRLKYIDLDEEIYIHTPPSLYDLYLKYFKD